MRFASLIALLGASALSACSGTVVVENDGGGGAGGSGTPQTTSSTKAASVTTATTVTVSSSTGFTPCDEHVDCGNSIGEDVCVFDGGFCAQRCGSGSPPCKPGLTCVECATSSCPGCEDCLGACL